MKIFITPGTSSHSPLSHSTSFDGSYYLQEILSASGLCYAERASLQDALYGANPQTDLLLLSAGGETEGVESFLFNGGNVIAIAPQASVTALANLSRINTRITSGRLRITAPLCPGARGEPLWTPGPQTIYKSELSVGECNRSTLAYLFEPDNPDSESIGIFEHNSGDGSLTVFAYDPAACISQLRQGLPERAGVLPPGEVVPRSTFLHEPNIPPDTYWRPTADLHAAVLCDVIKRLLSRRAPVPTLWHIPAGKPAILLFTGDEDGAAQIMNEHEMTDVESFGATMSLYIIPNETSITREIIAEYCRRGHELSVHPDLWPAQGQLIQEQLAKARSDVLMFRERFGQPVHTVRNHSGIWPGYLDLPELWEELGIGMDSSCLSSLLYQSPDDGPYVHVNAALPMRFVRPDGSLIDVYEQPPHISDDLSYHPTVGYSQKLSVPQSDWVIERMLEDAARWFYTPFCVIIHPSNYATFSEAQGKAFLHHARQMKLPIWPLGRWHSFWRARASWRMASHDWDGTHLSFTLTGTPCEQLCITLPHTFENMALSALSFNGAAVEFEQTERYKQLIAQALLPDGATEVQAVAEYSG